MTENDKICIWSLKKTSEIDHPDGNGSYPRVEISHR